MMIRKAYRAYRRRVEVDDRSTWGGVDNLNWAEADVLERTFRGESLREIGHQSPYKGNPDQVWRIFAQGIAILRHPV